MYRYLFIVFLLSFALNVHAQSIHAEFGKNRVQYHDDFDAWKRYETENFITHWYGKAKNIAIPTLQMLELYNDDVSRLIEHRMNDKIQVLVYTDVTDFKQTNVGLEEVLLSENNRSRIIDNKMLIYYDGNFKNLRRQVKEGIATVYLDEMLNTSSIKQMVRNVISFDQPEWYTKGIISYAGRKWDHLLDDELRDILEKNPKCFYDFRKLSADYPRIAGHSMWYYIGQKYGTDFISNLLYLTRLHRDVEEAILYATNQDQQKLFDEWSIFFSEHFGKESFSPESGELLNLRKKDDVPISTYTYSPKGKYLCYATNERGRVKVWLRDLDDGKEKKIIAYGSKDLVQATDYDYPHIVWSPQDSILSVFYEVKDEGFLMRYDVAEEASEIQLLPTALWRIYAADYLDDTHYILSASLDANSDLVKYEITDRTFERISSDYFDDLDASVITLGGRRGILFSSNRSNNDLKPLAYDTILPLGDYNLFFYDLEADDGSLFRITDTPDKDERYPISLENNEITFLANDNGINNIHKYTLLLNGSSRISNKSRNIIRHAYDPRKKRYLYQYYVDGKYETYSAHEDSLKNEVSTMTTYARTLATPQKEENNIDAREEEMQEGYYFLSEHDDPKNIEPIDRGFDVNQEKIGSDITNVFQFMNSDITASPLQFKMSGFTTKMDNSRLFGGMETYTGDQDQLLFNPMGLLMKVDFMDLLEDYVVSIGSRIPLNINGSEFFGILDDRKTRYDKKYILYRKYASSIQDQSTRRNPLRTQKTTWLGMFQWKYPFDSYRSLRFTPSLRMDTYRSEVVDNATWSQPAVTEERLALKVEYIYDNTSKYDFNILHGSRYKFYAEGINEFNIGIIDESKFELSNGFTGVLGYDARHYIPVLKHSVLAMRLSGGFSFGSKKNLYYIGDVNSNVLNIFDGSTPINRSTAFAYKSNVHHLRGFSSNARNGTSYILGNIELRVPFLKYALQYQRGWSFLKRLQLVGFFDLGTGWYGLSPFDDENPLNNVEVSRPPIITVNARYNRDPLIFGTGIGLRANVLGYTVRVDLGWGIDSGTVKRRKYHISFGKDF